MLAYDLIMLLVLVGATVFGAWKGLAWQIASVSSIVVSYFVAFEFRYAVATAIDAEPPWNLFLAMLLLYLGTSFFIWLAFRFVKSFIDRLKMQDFDRHLGGLVGAGKGVLLCVLITLFGVALLKETQRQSIIDSYSGYCIARLMDRGHGLVPEEMHDVLEPYLHSLDSRLPDGSSHHHDDHGVTDSHDHGGDHMATESTPTIR